MQMNQGQNPLYPALVLLPALGHKTDAFEPVRRFNRPDEPG
jgi:hypothetical protein